MATTVSTVLSYAETKAQAASGTINNTTSGVPFLNEALLDYRTELIKRGVDASQIQESYIPSVSVPTYPNTSTFAYPSDMYFLKTVEVNMQDTTQANYIPAKQIDVSNLEDGVSVEWLRLNQPSNEPLIDDRGDTYEIFPTFTSSMNLTNPIKVIYFLQPTPYVNLGDSLTYPDTLDYYILSLKVASLYLESLFKFDEAEILETKYQKRLEKLITTLNKGLQQPPQAQGLGLTGYEF